MVVGAYVPMTEEEMVQSASDGNVAALLSEIRYWRSKCQETKRVLSMEMAENAALRVRLAERTTTESLGGASFR